MAFRSKFVQILEMAADDSPLEDMERIDRLDFGADEMAGIRAGPQTAVPIGDERKDVMRVPKFVTRIVRAFGMVVNRHHDVVFLHQPLD